LRYLEKTGDNGELKIVKLLISFFLIISAFHSDLIGEGFGGAVGTGIKWNSNIEYYYLTNRLKYIELVDGEIVRYDPPEKSSFFLGGDASLNYAKKDFIFDYSLFVDMSPTDNEYSKINQYAEFSYSSKISERFVIDFSLLSHHSAEDFDNIKNLFLDFHFYTNLFYDYTSYLTLFSGIKAGYYKNMSSVVKYLGGPLGGVELGAYIYPGEGNSYIKFSGGTDFFSFNDETFNVSFCLKDDETVIKTLKTHNRYYKISAQSDAVWIANDTFSFFLKAQYFFVSWLDNDWWSHLDWEKKRKEHSFTFSTSMLFNLNKNLSLKLFYDVKRVWSSFGRDSNDYVNYNQLSRFTGTSLSLYF